MKPGGLAARHLAVGIIVEDGASSCCSSLSNWTEVKIMIDRIWEARDPLRTYLFLGGDVGRE
jgi:hypothetical protein